MRTIIGRIAGLQAAFAILTLSLLFITNGCTQNVSPDAVTAASSTPANIALTADNSPIRPFHFSASESDLTDLRRRVAATHWPDKEQVNDASQGVQLATMQ